MAEVSLRRIARAALGVGVVAVLAGLAVLAERRLSAGQETGMLYGNIEIREVDLAFNAEGTVRTMLRHEGHRVAAGELLAELDPATYQAAQSLMQARREAAQAQLDLLLAGSRAEDIQAAGASVAVQRAGLTHAQAVFDRQQQLVKTDTASRQAFDDARMALDTARAQLALDNAALAKAVNGPRPQEIAASRAELHSAEAAERLAGEQLAHTRLVAPPTAPS